MIRSKNNIQSRHLHTDILIQSSPFVELFKADITVSTAQKRPSPVRQSKDGLGKWTQWGLDQFALLTLVQSQFLTRFSVSCTKTVMHWFSPSHKPILTYRTISAAISYQPLCVRTNWLFVLLGVSQMLNWVFSRALLLFFPLHYSESSKVYQTVIDYKSLWWYCCTED